MRGSDLLKYQVQAVFSHVCLLLDYGLELNEKSCSPKSSPPNFDTAVSHVDTPDLLELAPWSDFRNIAFVVGRHSNALAETHCDPNTPLRFKVARTIRETKLFTDFESPFEQHSDGFSRWEVPEMIVKKNS